MCWEEVDFRWAEKENSVINQTEWWKDTKGVCGAKEDGDVETYMTEEGRLGEWIEVEQKFYFQSLGERKKRVIFG